ncbi:MAG: PVC-type heme-binding CxxCH protein [Rubripirellula sp.]
MPVRILAPRAVVLLSLLCTSANSLLAQRELTDIPKPDPTAEQAAMRLDELSDVNLFAADPDISKPIQMNFDSTGALWVASSEIYPQIKPGEVANDKVIVLRDTDGDGVADQRTVFADGLLIPTGVVPDGPHAAYVAESTRLLYLEDTDHDGKADKRRVVLSGFGTEDTHHLIHTLRFGPDGCLYFNQSIYIHSHVITPFGTRHLDGGGIWRYRPSTGQLEVFSKGFVNPWGLVFDAAGESFATDGAFFEGINYVFPDSVFVTSPGATRWLKGLNPGSPKHCGLEILSGTHIPPEWTGDMVANDFRSHRVCRFTIKPNGSGYLSRQQPEIITTQHVAFRPIDAKMGPDGALYIADWYNPIIQHGEVDFRDERRDRSHGRVWRVSFPGRELDHWPDFAASDVEGLLAMLEDPALSVRQFAREELWKRGRDNEADVLAAYRNWFSENTAARALELFWYYEVVGLSVGDDLLVMFDEVDPQHLRTLLRSLWRSRMNANPEQPRGAASKELTQLLNKILADRDDPRLLLEAVVCAGQLNAEISPEAVDAVLRASEQETDANLDFAIWQSLRNLDASYPNGSILTARQDWNDQLNELAFAVSAIGTSEAAEVAVKALESEQRSEDDVDALVKAIAVAGNASQLGRAVKSLLRSKAESLDAARLKPLLDRTLRDKTVPADVGEALARIASESDLNEDRIGTLAKIASVWKVSELEGTLVASLAQTEGRTKQRVIEALAAFDSDQVRKTLGRLAKSTDAGTRIAATQAIASSRPRMAIPLILDLLDDEETGDQATAMIVAMLGRKDLPPLLATAIASKQVSADRARGLLRSVRSGGGNGPLEEAIRKSGQLENAAWKLTPELKETLLTAIRSNGSAERGEAVYRQTKLQCINCHAIGSGGGLVGPNLISVGGSSQPDYIVESLLDPSSKLKEGFTTLTVLTDEAEVINGIVIGRDEKTVRMRLADGKEIQIATDAIEQEKPGKSLMPEGLLDSLTQSELVDLITFMTVLGREPAYTVSTEPILRSLETLVYTNEANRRLNRTSTDTAASDDPAMTWRAQTTKVDGTIPLIELDRFQQHRQTPPTSFIRFNVSMPQKGIAKIDLPTEGIEVWVDTKPTPIWKLEALQLAEGEHVIVLAIDRTRQTQPFAIRVDGDAVLMP